MSTCRVEYADTIFVKILGTTSSQALIHQYVRVASIYGLCLLLAQQVQAGITTCTLDDGSVVFQDTVCAVIPEPESKSVSVANNVPLGIDKTWFDAPSAIPHSVECTFAGCDCGEYSREFKHGLALAIADALYLDGSWHRFEIKMSQVERSIQGTTEFGDLLQERNEAACNILMSQKTLRLFGESALKQLRVQKRHAEDRGWDNPADCDAGDAAICEHTDNIALYNRIISDIQALSITARVDKP